MPLIHAAQRATEAEKLTIKEAVEGDELTQVQLRDVISIIRKYRGIEYTMERARGYIDNAKRNIETFDPSAERAALLALADFVIERTH